jgi:hypothetical protein
MAARAPRVSETSGTDDVLDRVLEAAQRAPLVPLTDEEQELLAEVEGQPVRWLPHEDFVSRVGLADRAD